METRIDDSELRLEPAAGGEEREDEWIVGDQRHQRVPLDTPRAQAAGEDEARAIELLVADLLAGADVDECRCAARDGGARPQHIRETRAAEFFHRAAKARRPEAEPR